MYIENLCLDFYNMVILLIKQLSQNKFMQNNLLKLAKVNHRGIKWFHSIYTQIWPYSVKN